MHVRFYTSVKYKNVIKIDYKKISYTIPKDMIHKLHESASCISDPKGITNHSIKTRKHLLKNKVLAH